MKKETVKHLTSNATINALTDLTGHLTIINQLFILAVATNDNILLSRVQNLMQPDINVFLKWLLDMVQSKFSSLHPYYLYKLLMIFWHGAVVIAAFGGFKLTLPNNYPSPTDLLAPFKQCLTLVCNEIRLNRDWRYLDVFLYGATLILLNEHDPEWTSQVNEILRMFDKNVRSNRVYDAGSFLVSTGYCCDSTKHGQKAWTPHLFAGILLLTLVKSWCM